MQWTYNPALVLRAYELWERANFVGLPPKIEEVADLDPAYLADLSRMGELVRFHRHALKRARGVR